jgi:ADYC domain
MGGATMARLLVISASVALLSAAAYGRDVPDRIVSIVVDGTAFRVSLASGKSLSGADLTGAILSLDQPAHAPLKVLVQSVEVDPMDPDRETLLYHLLAVDAQTGHRKELCDPDAQGQRWAFPLRGQWDTEGRHLSNVGYTLTCADGAQGKCVRFGYKPWKVLPNGVRLEAYHQACIRLVRADYCGGHGTTRDGMLIDIYDNLGIQTPDPNADAADVRFEAAWNTRGAVCVAHTRVPEKITLRQLGIQCPRLAGKLDQSVCTEANSGRWGERVLLYNRSR